MTVVDAQHRRVFFRRNGDLASTATSSGILLPRVIRFADREATESSQHAHARTARTRHALLGIVQRLVVATRQSLPPCRDDFASRRVRDLRTGILTSATHRHQRQLSKLAAPSWLEAPAPNRRPPPTSSSGSTLTDLKLPEANSSSADSSALFDDLRRPTPPQALGGLANSSTQPYSCFPALLLRTPPVHNAQLRCASTLRAKPTTTEQAHRNSCAPSAVPPAPASPPSPTILMARNHMTPSTKKPKKTPPVEGTASRNGKSRRSFQSSRHGNRTQ